MVRVVRARGVTSLPSFPLMASCPPLEKGMAHLLEYAGSVHIYLGPYRGNPISLYLKRTETGCQIGPKVYPWNEVVGSGETPNKAAADFEEKWKTKGLSADMYSGPSWEGGIKPEKPAPPKPPAAPKPAVPLLHQHRRVSRSARSSPTAPADPHRTLHQPWRLIPRQIQLTPIEEPSRRMLKMAVQQGRSEKGQGSVLTRPTPSCLNSSFTGWGTSRV